MTGEWRPIEEAPRDGTDFVGGWFFNGGFVTDVCKFYKRAGDKEARIIQARYRHRLDPAYYMPPPPAPGAA